MHRHADEKEIFTGKQHRNGEFYGQKFKLGSSWNWCDRK